MINIRRLEIVREEVKRLERAIDDLYAAMRANPDIPSSEQAGLFDDKVNLSFYVPRQTGAVRRASMDLTRTLTDLRRSERR